MGGRCRASTPVSIPTPTISRRPLPSTISIRSTPDDDASTFDGDFGAISTGAKLGCRSVPRAPSRNCRRQVVSKDREIPCARAVAETSRDSRKLASTMRTLSASLQCRRRAASAADRTSISSPDLRSTIRSHLSPSSEPSQAAPGGGLRFYDVLDARADPDHQEHQTAVTWLDDYDPDIIDELPIKYALGRIAARRNAAAKTDKT